MVAGAVATVPLIVLSGNYWHHFPPLCLIVVLFGFRALIGVPSENGPYRTLRLTQRPKFYFYRVFLG